MRHNDGHKNNGLTKNDIKLDKSVSLNFDKQFLCFLLSTPHFEFNKPVLAIPKLSTFIFASTKAKINKLNCSPQIGVLRTFFVRALNASQSTPQAYGFLFLSAGKACLTVFYKNKLGFP
ncbi:MAG: hypothetical protein JSU07_04955 [Bacteroidetes bacterium]|nr:hypothetical protein [Bacteroidota bacterium]